MGIGASIRDAIVALAAETETIQDEVIIEAWIGHADAYAQPAYAAPVRWPALIQEGTNQRRLPNGDVITTRACVSFLEPPPPNGATGRREPIDPRDKITLPSGLTGPIVDNHGAMVDKLTGRPFIGVFWIR